MTTADPSWRTPDRHASTPGKRPQPLDADERSTIAGVTLVGAADQLAELAGRVEDDPDYPLPEELQRSGIGPLQLFGVARYLCARAGLYGVDVELVLPGEADAEPFPGDAAEPIVDAPVVDAPVVDVEPIPPAPLAPPPRPTTSTPPL